MGYSLSALWNWAFGKRSPDSDDLIRQRFTDRARWVLQSAGRSARKWGHEYIGTEHSLLGLLEGSPGVGAYVLKEIVGSIERVRAATEATMEPGPGVPANGKLPQTPQAKKVVEFSIDEAVKLNHRYVGTEHILLALLRESDGRVAGVFAALGIGQERVREKVLAILGGGLNA